MGCCKFGPRSRSRPVRPPGSGDFGQPILYFESGQSSYRRDCGRIRFCNLRQKSVIIIALSLLLLAGLGIAVVSVVSSGGGASHYVPMPDPTPSPTPASTPN